MWRSRSFVAVLLVVLLAGCAGVPTSGPVEHHTPQSNGLGSDVRVDPLPPADGASQLLVVEGFLHAMSVYQAGYTVARQYLTEAASQAWHPEAGVQVYTETDPPVESEQGVALSGMLVGTVDPAGVYLPVNTPLRRSFALMKNSAGQWRISNPPDGLLVSRYLFSTNFTSLNLHYLDAAGTVLVPDPRYFATGEQSLAAALRAQLDGPSEWLAPAVRTPETREVVVDSALVDTDGLLDIRLGNGAEQLSVEDRQTVLAQLAYTLTELPQVTSIKVSGNGQLWRSEHGQDEIRPDLFPQLSPANVSAPRSLFVAKEGKLQRLRNSEEWNDLETVEVNLPTPEAFAVRTDLMEVAAITEKGGRLAVASVNSGKTRELRSGQGLLRPAYARNGELWSPATSGLSGLRVYRDGIAQKIELADVPGGQLVAAALSPDGARIALVVRRGNGVEVGLAVVERSDSGILLAGWRSLDLTLNAATAGTALDVGWASESELLVLRTGGALEVSVTRQSQDGSTSTDLGPSESAALTRLAVMAGRQAVALTNGGVAYRFDGEFNWSLVFTAVDAVAYSG